MTNHHLCEEKGCHERGVVNLEIVGPPLWEQEIGRFHWYCEAHAHAAGERVGKDGRAAKVRAVIPVVGMGATVGVGSDRYPYTVVDVSLSGKTIVVQADIYKAAPGCNPFGSQEYIYSPNPEGPKDVYSLRNNGRWVLKGDSARGQELGLGHREHYCDPHF